MSKLDELLKPVYEESKKQSFDTQEMIMGLRFWLRLDDCPARTEALNAMRNATKAAEVPQDGIYYKDGTNKVPV